MKRRLLTLLIVALPLAGCINLPVKQSGNAKFQKSLEGMPILDVAYVEQQSAVSCGAAVLESVTRYWDQPLEQAATFTHHPPADSEKGYALAELKQITKTQTKLNAFVIKGDDKLLQKMVAKGRPVIVAVRTEPRRIIEIPIELLSEIVDKVVSYVIPSYNHYIVVIGSSQERLAIMDPVQGYYTLEREAFLKTWGELGNATLIVSR